MKVVIGFFVVLLVTTTLLPAQSINIDLGQPGAPRPPDRYRGAGLPGYWNKFDAVSTQTTYSLYGLDGTLTPATVHQIGGTEIVTTPLGGAGQPQGADAVLLGDALVTHTTVENCLFFDNLDPGTYEVLTYAWMPTAPLTPNRVRIDSNPTVTTVGAPWTGSHAETVTFARHLVSVTQQRLLRPHSGVPSGGDYTTGAALNGMQIRRLVPQPPLFVSRARLEWLTSSGATSYDVVRGDLAALRSTGGNFSVATTACLANNLSGTAFDYAPSPSPGAGDWFLVRGVGPGGGLTWDEPGASQVASRDAEINASPVSCP